MSLVWHMLDACAPGHTRTLGRHNFVVRWKSPAGDDLTYAGFPSGAHGARDPAVRDSHIRKLARHLNIVECAARHLPAAFH